uniref:Uncharacterized protein n=1 Tax=viral metagenome TaxID=1070528 RepID=A0A6C0AYY2_9ZZZZ|tara:strand:- start:26573 stop:26854 length:282 start_codon:yes stop_codon:yes gene_type:complete
MSLYPKIHDQSILLDNDCKRLLKRTSRQKIIDEVMHKLSENNKKNKSNIDKIDYYEIELDNDDINYYENDNKSTNDNKSLYEIVLCILGCNIK